MIVDKNQTFGEQIKMHNGRLQLRQNVLASRMGVSVTTIRNWEQGKPPGLANFKALLIVYLQEKGFLPSQEVSEAKALWQLWLAVCFGESDDRPKDTFDEAWFKDQLLQAQNSFARVEEDKHQQQEVETDVSREDESKQQDEIISEGEVVDEEITEEVPHQEVASKFLVSRRAMLFGLGSFCVGVLVGRITVGKMGEAKQQETNWNVTGSMQLSRSSFRATTLTNSMVLVEGGRTVADGYTNESERFDPQRSIWTKTRSTMNLQRAEHTATLLQDGRVLVIGGYAIGVWNTAEMYSPTSDTWTLTRHSMSVPRTRHTATLLQDGRILVVGGLNNSTHATAEIYDSEHDRWTSAGTMTTARMDHIAVRLYDGRVLVAGGTTANDGHSCTATSEVYDPRTNEWTALPDMRLQRAYFTATLLPDGRVQVIGGRLPDYSMTSTTEIYDPFTEHWSFGASMHNARQNTRGDDAFLLEDGMVLVAGGDTHGTSEIYLPTKDTWTSLHSLHNIHYVGTTALLSKDRVLIMGGLSAFANESESSYQTPSTEIYVL